MHGDASHAGPLRTDNTDLTVNNRSRSKCDASPPTKLLWQAALIWSGGGWDWIQSLSRFRRILLLIWVAIVCSKPKKRSQVGNNGLKMRPGGTIEEYRFLKMSVLRCVAKRRGGDNGDPNNRYAYRCLFVCMCSSKRRRTKDKRNGRKGDNVTMQDRSKKESGSAAKGVPELEWPFRPGNKRHAAQQETAHNSLERYTRWRAFTYTHSRHTQTRSRHAVNTQQKNQKSRRREWQYLPAGLLNGVSYQRRNALCSEVACESHKLIGEVVDALEGADW